MINRLQYCLGWNVYILCRYTESALTESPQFRKMDYFCVFSGLIMARMGHSGKEINRLDRLDIIEYAKIAQNLGPFCIGIWFEPSGSLPYFSPSGELV